MMVLYEMVLSLFEKEEMLWMCFLEEGEWGLDFILKMCFGDGFRVISVGMMRWMDGFVGGMDDVIVCVYN